MKSFDEFWNTLSEEKFCEIADKANAGAEAMKDDTSDTSKILGNQVAITSTIFTKEILKLYHEWLSEQL